MTKQMLAYLPSFIDHAPLPPVLFSQSLQSTLFAKFIRIGVYNHNSCILTAVKSTFIALQKELHFLERYNLSFLLLMGFWLVSSFVIME